MLLSVVVNLYLGNVDISKLIILDVIRELQLLVMQRPPVAASLVSQSQYDVLIQMKSENKSQKKKTEMKSSSMLFSVWEMSS